MTTTLPAELLGGLTWMIEGLSILGRSSSAASAACPTGVAISGVETLIGAGLRKGFSRKAITLDAATIATAANAVSTVPALRETARAAQRGSWAFCPSGRSMSFCTGDKPHPRGRREGTLLENSAGRSPAESGG